MRTFRYSAPPASVLAATLTIAVASIVISSPAAAQRHGTRAESISRHRVQPVAAPVVVADTLGCDAESCDESTPEEIVPDEIEPDYRLGVVNALFPYNDGTTAGPPLLTLVIENSGTARSPGSIVAVAPRNHLSLVSRLMIPSLAPGERSVVQLPLEIGPDGAPCIAITISPNLTPTLSETLRYASAASTIGAPRPPGK